MAKIDPAELDEVDNFLAAEKWLYGDAYEWRLSSFYKGKNLEHEAIWPVADKIGIVGKGQLRIAYRPWNSMLFSISLIYGQFAVYRLDKENPLVCEHNPHWARAMGVPPVVCGTHVHTWADNKEHIRSTGERTLPVRRPLPPQIQTLKQALLHLADSININLTREQYAIEPPKELF